MHFFVMTHMSYSIHNEKGYDSQCLLMLIINVCQLKKFVCQILVESGEAAFVVSLTCFDWFYVIVN